MQGAARSHQDKGGLEKGCSRGNPRFLPPLDFTCFILEIGFSWLHVSLRSPCGGDGQEMLGNLIVTDPSPPRLPKG